MVNKSATDLKQKLPATVTKKEKALKPAKKSLQNEWVDVINAAPGNMWKAKGDSAKKLMRWAFSGAQQEAGPYPALTSFSFQALIQALIDHAKESCLENKDLAGKPLAEQLAIISEKVSLSAHSHPGKYVHPDSKELWLQPPGHELSPFLTSRSAGHVRWFSACFSHAPQMTGAGFCFYAQFERSLKNGLQIVCLAELLACKDELTLIELGKQGLSAADLKRLCDIWGRAFKNKERKSSATLPTLRWPLFDQGSFQYDELNALPSLAVYNNLKKMRAIASDAGLSLKVSSFAVGSGQAQNISVAATHSAGAIPILLCAPPRIKTDRIDWLQRKAHSKPGLIAPLPKEELEKLEQAAESMHEWPNINRYKKLSYLAKIHVELALKDCVDLQEHISENPELASSLHEKLAPAFKKILRGSELYDDHDQRYWMAELLSENVKKALSMHTLDSQAFYEKELWRGARRLLGLIRKGSAK